MSTQTQVSLKLLIDKKGKKILYGEADKKFIDFLFTILALPVGTVSRLLSNEAMAGPLSNLYRSVDALNISYFDTKQNKDSLLKPMVTVTKSQLGDLLQIESSASKRYYACHGGNNCRKYFTATYNAACPGCRSPMTFRAKYVLGADEAKSNEGGYVKGMVTYMVMDDLTVKPMTSISTISLLNALNVDVGQIVEKVIYLDMKEGVKLLRASLHSLNVLTDVFFHKIDFSKDYVSNNVEDEEGDESVKRLWKLLMFLLFLAFSRTCHLFK